MAAFSSELVGQGKFRHRVVCRICGFSEAGDGVAGPQEGQSRPIQSFALGFLKLQLPFFEQGDVFHGVANFVFAGSQVLLSHIATVIDEQQGRDIEPVG